MSTERVRISYERVAVTELRQGDVIILGDSRSNDYPALPVVVCEAPRAVHGGHVIVTGAGADVDYKAPGDMVTRLFALEPEPNRFAVSCFDDHGRDDVAMFGSLDAALAYANRQPAGVQCNVEGLAG